MAHRTASPGSGRLAAVLDPWPSRPVSGVPVPAADDDAPTVPIPVRTPRAPGRRPGLLDRWLPAAWRDARIDPGRPGALAVVLVGVVAAVVAAVGVWREAPRAEPVAALPALVTTTAATAPTSSATAAVPDDLVVAVAGKVRRPGLVRVPPGSRVADVVEAAGGVLPGVDLAGVNLARKVSDGEQVAVGVPPAPDARSAQAAGPEPGTGGPGVAPLDLNMATVEQLDALPGVGPVTAQRIVDWRTRNGRFATVEQLREVEGIGERRLGQLRELVRT